MEFSADTATTLYQALSQFREQVQIQSSELESALPRKGKNRATDRDAELETQRHLCLENIERCLSAVPQMAAAAAAGVDDSNKKPTSSPDKLIWNDAAAAYFAFSSAAPDEEPYVNPFTGEFVYPESTSNFRPGPSGTQGNDDAKSTTPPARRHTLPTPMVPAPSHPLAERPRDFAQDNKSAIWNGGTLAGAGPYLRFPAPQQPTSETSGHDIIMQGFEAPARTTSFISATGEPVTLNNVRKAKTRTGPTTANSWGRLLGLRGGILKRSDAEELQGLAPDPAVPELDAARGAPGPAATGDGPAVATNKPNKAARRKNRNPAKDATVLSEAETTLFQNFSLPLSGPAPEQQTTPTGLSDAAAAVRKAYANGKQASLNVQNSHPETTVAGPSPLDQSEQDRLYALHLQQQWDADAELARRLAHEDDDDDDDDDGTMFTPESEDEGLFTAEMLAEQQNLWAAFAAQTEDDTEQEAFARRLQEKIAAEEEQEELARRIQEEWDRQEREDREYAERLMEEQRREEEEELEEVRRIAEEIERKERMADCVVCTEEFEKEVLLMLPCEHAYCEGCLRRPFQLALDEKQPFRCCGNRADIDDAARHFDDAFVAAYKLMLLERDAPNPLYCSAPKCSAFIMPAAIHGGVGTCPRCPVRTCAFCRLAEHSDVCSTDTDGQRVRDLAKTNGWKTCPNCKSVVERNQGCLHMTCRCGTEFCYNCNALYTQCSGGCVRT